MKRMLAVLIAASAAMAIPAPAMAWDGAWNAPLAIGVGIGYLIGRPAQQQVQGQQVILVPVAAGTRTTSFTDSKIAGTPCRDNKSGRISRWQQIDGQMWC